MIYGRKRFLQQSVMSCALVPFYPVPLVRLPSKMATTERGPPKDGQNSLFSDWRRDVLRRVHGNPAKDRIV